MLLLMGFMNCAIELGLHGMYEPNSMVRHHYGYYHNNLKGCNVGITDKRNDMLLRDRKLVQMLKQH
jgi:hypothetical protein